MSRVCPTRGPPGNRWGASLIAARARSRGGQRLQSDVSNTAGRTPPDHGHASFEQRCPGPWQSPWGHGCSGCASQIKGELIIDAQGLTFADGDKTIFTIPIANVMKATNAVENNSGGMGRKLMFGNLSNRSEGFVYVTTETADAAEALVFKVGQKAPAGIVAKIEFAMKKEKGQ